LYDPDQTTDPSTGAQLPSGRTALQVYLQAYKAHEETWPNVFIEIWRANSQQKSGSVSAANVAIRAHFNTDAQPCGNDFTPLQLGSMPVAAGSTTIDIDQNHAFDLTDADGNIFESGCIFVGTGDYAPEAPALEVVTAGTLECKSGYSVDCLRPNSDLASTCNNADVDTCGTVGGTCVPYYQLLAVCLY
jgi:hypothetical protein